jgi:hypothetical protein
MLLKYHSSAEQNNKSDFKPTQSPEPRGNGRQSKFALVALNVDGTDSYDSARSQMEIIPSNSTSQENLINLDDLSPVKTKPADSLEDRTPKFNFRSMRRGGTTLILKKASDGFDPSTKYSMLVRSVNLGRVIPRNA